MFKDKKYVCYRWPLLVKNRKRKIKFKYESDLERCETLINSISKDIDLYIVQLVGLDKLTHEYGKSSLNYEKKVRQLDKAAEFIFRNFKKRIKNIDVIFWSDHSFVDIKKTIDITKLLPKTNDYLVFVGGTTLSFWFKNNQIKKKIIEILKLIKEGHILNKNEIKKYHISVGKENGELIFVMNPGNYIYPNYYQGKNPYKAMHGYEPDKHDSDGILLTNIKLKKKSYSLNEVIKL